MLKRPWNTALSILKFLSNVRLNVSFKCDIKSQ